MELIENNPFRVLALPLTASAREIERQINTLGTYAEMGKTKSLETDLSFLPQVSRSVEDIDKSKRQLQIDEQKFFHSLFWFWKNNTVDELALELLNEGKVDKAIDIWEKAIFAKRKKVYKSEFIEKNLIRESNGWPEQDDDVFSLKIENGKYVVELKTERSLVVFPCTTGKLDEYENWSISCDAEWFEGDSGHGHGISFGRNEGSFFAFFVSANGFYSFDKYVDWNYQDGIPWTECDDIDKWELNQIQIKQLEGRFWFYINGELVNSVESEPVFGQLLGLCVEKNQKNQKIVFSNFQVCSLHEDDGYGQGIVVTAKNVSCIKNLSLLFLSQAVNHGKLTDDLFQKSLALSEKFFSARQFISYSKMVAGERFIRNPEETLETYVNALVENLRPCLDKTYGVTTSDFIDAFSVFPDKTHNLVKNGFVAKRIQNLNHAIERSTEQRKASPKDAVKIGSTLIENAEADISYLCNILDENDIEYELVADKLSYEVIACGIDSFNATKNDENGLHLYEYGNLIAATAKAEKWAIENVKSCKLWIENKDYLICFFCGKNEPNKNCMVSETMYLETYRSYFPRRVEFSYGDVAIPRCSECAAIHQQRTSYLQKYYGIVIASVVIGFLLGAVIAPQQLAFPSGVISAIIVGLCGLFVTKKFITPVDSHGVKLLGAVSKYPPVKKRLLEGWTFSKPSA